MANGGSEICESSLQNKDVVVLSLAARSLGSVAMRKAENLERGIHMNVFTIDFNEELVALYGGSLRRQTQFLHESIKAILRLYKVRGQGVVFTVYLFVPLFPLNFLSFLLFPSPFPFYHFLSLSVSFLKLQITNYSILHFC